MVKRILEEETTEIKKERLKAEASRGRVDSYNCAMDSIRFLLMATKSGAIRSHRSPRR